MPYYILEQDGSEVEAIKGASVDEKEKKPKAAKKAVKETNEEWEAYRIASKIKHLLKNV